jgi:hypothetical protein
MQPWRALRSALSGRSQKPQPATPGLTNGIPWVMEGLSSGRIIIERIGSVRRNVLRGLAHDLDDLSHNIAPVAADCSDFNWGWLTPLHLRCRYPRSDALIACSVFEHIRKPWLAAEEIGKILKPGGTAFTRFTPIRMTTGVSVARRWKPYFQMKMVFAISRVGMIFLHRPYPIAFRLWLQAYLNVSIVVTRR